MESHPIPERISVFKLTDDDWCPSFRIDGYYNSVKGEKLVEVTFLQFSDFSGWRCCVWGADDDGRDFDGKDRELVWKMFLAVISQPKVNKGFLQDKGFVRA